MKALLISLLIIGAIAVWRKSIHNIRTRSKKARLGKIEDDFYAQRELPLDEDWEQGTIAQGVEKYGKGNIESGGFVTKNTRDFFMYFRKKK